MHPKAGCILTPRHPEQTLHLLLLVLHRRGVLSPRSHSLGPQSTRGTAHCVTIPSQHSCKRAVTDLQPPHSCSASPRSPECPPAVSGMREGQSWCPSILQAGHNSIWGWIHQQTKTVCMSRNIWKRRSGSSTFNHLILISLNPFSLCFRCAVPNGIRCCRSTNIHHPAALCRALRNFVLFSVSFPSRAYWLVGICSQMENMWPVPAWGGEQPRS